MASIRRRARQRDRDQTIDALAIAFSEDQLSAKEHEARVARAIKAVQLSSLATQLKDLQLPPSHPAAKIVKQASQPPATTATRTPQLRSRGTPMEPARRRRWLIGLGVAGALVAGATAVGAIDDSQEPPDFKAEEVASMQRLVDDYQDEFGTSETLQLTVYDDYADVLVPNDSGPGRFDRYHYGDDGFTKQERGGVSTDSGHDLVDLESLDVDQLVANRQRGRRGRRGRGRRGHVRHRR